MPKIGGHGEVACGLKPKSINETGGQVALGFFESSTSRSGLMRTPEGDLEVELSMTNVSLSMGALLLFRDSHRPCGGLWRLLPLSIMPNHD